MDPSYIERVIGIVGNAAVGVVDALVPVGTALAGSFIVLSIVMCGASLMAGGFGLSTILRMTGAAAGTLWAIREWSTIVRGTLNGAREAIAQVIPGYTGPSALFGMATDIAGRIELEAIACSWNSMRCLGLSFLAALTGPIVWVGLAFTGLLATIAEFQLLIGAIAAPLVLPALAFPITSHLGWGPVNFMVKAGVRVVVMGITSWLMAEALSQTISVTGSTDGLTSQTVYTLIGLSVLTLMIGLYINSVANDMVGGGAGSLGFSAASRTGGMLASAGGTVASAAANPAAAAARAGVSTVKSAVGTITRSSGSGSAFN